MSFLAIIANHRRQENPAVDAFIAAAHRNIDALQSGKLTNRSWAKETGEGVTVKFGKLDGIYDFQSKDQVVDALREAIHDARADAAFREMIEAAYGEPVEEAPVKRKYTRKAKTEA